MKSQRKSKLRLKTLNKSYSLNDSIFHKLSSKKKLAEILYTDLGSLKKLTSDSCYNCFLTGIKKRNIQVPSYELDVVQTRIGSLLCRIKQPEYIHSGVTGKSHITNAKAHIGKHKTLTTDISAFFPSTTRQMIFNFFYNQLKCSSDVSDLLSKLCSYNDYIPTGSRISMPLAFWANYPMFQQLHDFSLSNHVIMTVFVDDISFSGNRITRQFQQKIQKIIKQHNHIMHPNKTKFYNENTVKLITGVAINHNELLVSNKQHKKIYQDIELWKGNTLINSSLLGRLNSQSLINPKLKDKVRSIKQKIRSDTS